MNVIREVVKHQMESSKSCTERIIPTLFENLEDITSVAFSYLLFVIFYW